VPTITGDDYGLRWEEVSSEVTNMKTYIISHTHWDREWYQTFQDYRARLIVLLDELIAFMEQNPAFKYYHLDGQTIVLEDYLEVRPENRKRLQRLVRQGRIIPGPWYVMPDGAAKGQTFWAGHGTDSALLCDGPGESMKIEAESRRFCAGGGLILPCWSLVSRRRGVKRTELRQNSG